MFCPRPRADFDRLFNDLLKQTKREKERPYRFAVLRMSIGENECAPQLLKIGYQQHSFGLLALKTSPAWDALRGAPRFQALVRRVGLP